MSKTDRDEEMPAMMRGALLTHRRRCGKASCRCARGQLHESPVLSVRLSGRSVTISLRPGEVPAVQAALERYRAAKAELEAAANEGVAALRERRRR